MKRHLWSIGAVLALAAVLAGCGTEGGSSKAFEQLLPRLVGPAQRFEVKVSGVSADRLGAAKIRANRLQVEDNLVLDYALIDLSDVRFDRERRELLGVSRADYTGVLLQEDLNATLQKRSSLVRNLRIRFTAQGAQLRGSTDIPGLKLPITPEITMDGRLTVDELGRLSFEPERVRAVGFEIPSVAGRLLAAQINPLVDLTGGRLPVHLRDFELGNGEVRLFGRATVRTGLYPEYDRKW